MSFIFNLAWILKYNPFFLQGTIKPAVSNDIISEILTLVSLHIKSYPVVMRCEIILKNVKILPH